jgi:hypothetical protein
MAKVSRKVLREQVKALYLAKVREGLEGDGEEVLLVGSNKLAIPVVDAEGNEDFITITISIPTGSRDDNEPYDGYGQAESYRLKLEENQRKAEEKAKKKAEKIKRDEEFRRKKAEQKAKAKSRT